MSFKSKSLSTKAATTSPLPGDLSSPALDQSLLNLQVSRLLEYLGGALSNELSEISDAWTQTRSASIGLSDEASIQIDIARKAASLSKIDSARVLATRLVALELASLREKWVSGPYVPFTPADGTEWFTVPNDMGEALDLLSARPVVEGSFCFVASNSGITYSAI